MMNFLDLFSGCGGMSLGFQNAGYKTLAAADSWDAAISVYSANFDHPIHNIDLSDHEAYEIFDRYSPDMIIGGPPCQDFSSAGKRDESLGRADLTVTFAEIVSKKKPTWFVMENVDRIVKSYNLRLAKKIFKKAGYALSEQVLLASHCGVPQNRKRYFLIGELNGRDGALLPYFEKNQSQERMTVYDYLGDSLGIEYYYRHPRTYQRRAIFSIHEPSPTIRGVNRPVPSTYTKHNGDVGPVTPELRALTTVERSYIQTFPKTFSFEGTKTNLEQMIGNAVPVNMAQFVADCIQQYVDDKDNDSVLESEIPEQLSLL